MTMKDIESKLIVQQTMISPRGFVGDYRTTSSSSFDYGFGGKGPPGAAAACYVATSLDRSVESRVTYAAKKAVPQKITYALGLPLGTNMSIYYTPEDETRRLREWIEIWRK